MGGPVSDKLAYRVSYAGEDSEGWYNDEYRKSHSLYAALTYRPDDDYELFLNAQGYYAEYTENFGINRPTNNLIRRGLYRTGVNSNQGAGSGVPKLQSIAGTAFSVPATARLAGASVCRPFRLSKALQIARL